VHGPGREQLRYRRHVRRRRRLPQVRAGFSVRRRRAPARR
jgi:hypothetical protein